MYEISVLRESLGAFFFTLSNATGAVMTVVAVTKAVCRYKVCRGIAAALCAAERTK